MPEQKLTLNRNESYSRFAFCDAADKLQHCNYLAGVQKILRVTFHVLENWLDSFAILVIFGPIPFFGLYYAEFSAAPDGAIQSLIPHCVHPLYHFILSFGIAPFVPYLSTYARQLGFSSFIIGIIYTVIPIFGMAAKPILGLISDKYKCQKQVFIGVVLLTGLSAIGLRFIPRLGVESAVKINCGGDQRGYIVEIPGEGACVNQELIVNGNVSCQLNCPSLQWNVNATLQYQRNIGSSLYFQILEDATHCSNATCLISCNLEVLNLLSEKPALDDTQVLATHQFWLLLLLMIFCWIGQAVTISLGDTICFELLGDQSHKYGEQRMYGSLGWGVLCVATGYIIDSASSEASTKTYTLAFYLASLILVLNAFICSKIQVNQTDSPKHILTEITPLLRDPCVVLYLLWVVCVGLCTGLVWQFLFWLLEDLAAAKGCETYTWIKTLEGAAIAVQSFSEVLVLFLSGWIIKKLGHERSMSLVLFAVAAKFLLYSVIADPRWILLVELGNGLTIGLFYSCMASYANVVSTSGTKATVQGMVGAALDGGGVAVGSLVGGYLYKVYGGQKTFFIFGIGALIACVLHSVLCRFVTKSERVSNCDGQSVKNESHS